MSNIGIDVVGLLKYIDEARKAKGTEPRAKKPEVLAPPNAIDLIGFLNQRRQENAMIDAFFKDLEKANKKEEPKKGLGFKKLEELSATKLAFILMATFPLYVWASLKILGVH